jgi:hypothetical protein
MAAMTHSVDLESEFRVAVIRFHRKGCILPGDLCLYLSVGLQRIEPDGNLYQPADHGPLALVLPVYSGPTPSFMTPAEDSELVDIVAFQISRPKRWWRRTGLADYLGEHLIRSSVTWGRSLKVFETPFAWLKAYCQGVCPLSQDYTALRDPAELRFDDPAFASRVKRVLVRPFPIPRILVKDIAA